MDANTRNNYTSKWDADRIKVSASKSLVANTNTVTSTQEPTHDMPATPQLTYFPNPVHERLFMDLDLPATTPVRLELRASDGRFVKLIEEQTFDGGRHRLELDVSGLPQGLYFCRLIVKGKNSSIPGCCELITFEGNTFGAHHINNQIPIFKSLKINYHEKSIIFIIHKLIHCVANW